MTYLFLWLIAWSFKSLAPIMWMPQVESQITKTTWKTLREYEDLLEIDPHLFSHTLVPLQELVTPLYSMED